MVARKELRVWLALEVLYDHVLQVACADGAWADGEARTFLCALSSYSKSSRACRYTVFCRQRLVGFQRQRKCVVLRSLQLHWYWARGSSSSTHSSSGSTRSGSSTRSRSSGNGGGLGGNRDGSPSESLTPLSKHTAVMQGTVVARQEERLRKEKTRCAACKHVSGVRVFNGEGGEEGAVANIQRCA